MVHKLWNVIHNCETEIPRNCKNLRHHSHLFTKLIQTKEQIFSKPQALYRCSAQPPSGEHPPIFITWVSPLFLLFCLLFFHCSLLCIPGTACGTVGVALRLLNTSALKGRSVIRGWDCHPPTSVPSRGLLNLTAYSTLLVNVFTSVLLRSCVVWSDTVVWQNSQYIRDIFSAQDFYSGKLTAFWLTFAANFSVIFSSTFTCVLLNIGLVVTEIENVLKTRLKFQIVSCVNGLK